MARHIHKLPLGHAYARSRGCKHSSAEAMSDAEFRRLPVVRCDVDDCNAALGRICPDCKAVY